VTVPLPLLAIRGEEMTRSEVAAVLGMTDWGVALLEKRALQRFRDTWVRMFG
jgi:transcriptional regulator